MTCVIIREKALFFEGPYFNILYATIVYGTIPEALESEENGLLKKKKKALQRLAQHYVKQLAEEK